MNLLDALDAQSIRTDVPLFRAGDTVKVHARVVDDATWVSRETTAVSLWGHSFAGPAAP